MKQLLYSFLFSPVLLMAQTDSLYHSVQFEKGKTWEQIKAKAKNENKYTPLDSIMGIQGYAQKQVDAIIYQQELKPIIDLNLKKKNDLNWDSISNEIKNHFSSSCTERNVIQAKCFWYGSRKEYEKWTKYEIIKVENYGPSWLGLNGEAWNVFLVSNDRKSLIKALSWVEKDLAKDPKRADALDTKANILYKLGRRKEAIAIERRAMNIDEQDAIKNNREPNDEFKKTLKKMQSGLPTYINER